MSEPDLQPESPALLDAQLLEALVLNLDASLGVHARPHFFTWTQGLLQSLIRHKMLICALRSGDPLSFRVDSFSTLVSDAAIFSRLLLRESVAARLIKAWRGNQFRPLVCETGEVASLSGAAFAREFERVGGAQLVVHGSYDAEGEMSSIFVFACEAHAVGPRESYILQLIVPSLHTAWVRSQVHERTEGAPPVAPGVAVLTSREQEILRWICLGKSNGEVGAILEISPLTVKNHVQKLLRKLNVVNRAQAVGKALDARIVTL